MCCEKAELENLRAGWQASRKYAEPSQGPRVRGHGSLLLCGPLGHLLKSWGETEAQEANDPLVMCVQHSHPYVVAPTQFCVHHIECPSLCLASGHAQSLGNALSPAPVSSCLSQRPAPSFIQVTASYPPPMSEHTHTPSSPAVDWGTAEPVSPTEDSQGTNCAKGETEDCPRSDRPGQWPAQSLRGNRLRSDLPPCWSCHCPAAPPSGCQMQGVP